MFSLPEPAVVLIWVIPTTNVNVFRHIPITGGFIGFFPIKCDSLDVNDRKV
jgi:hypothetical protein